MDISLRSAFTPVQYGAELQI